MTALLDGTILDVIRSERVNVSACVYFDIFGQWFSKYDSQTRSISISWELVRIQVSRLTSDRLNQKLGARGIHSSFTTRVFRRF